MSVNAMAPIANLIVFMSYHSFPPSMLLINGGEISRPAPDSPAGGIASLIVSCNHNPAPRR
jgi:hypothetical protein